MYLEQEVYGFLIFAFICIALLAAIVLAVLYWKSRNKHILWFGGQLLFLCLAFYFFFQAVSNLPVPGFSMYTEEQSFAIGRAGVCWAVSMVFMLFGIYKLLRKRDVIYQF